MNKIRSLFFSFFLLTMITAHSCDIADYPTCIDIIGTFESGSRLTKSLNDYGIHKFALGVSQGVLYKIGQQAQGGIIVYLTADGLHGLAASIV